MVKAELRTVYKDIHCRIISIFKRLINDLEGMWREAVVNYSQEVVWYLPTGTEENHDKPVGIPIILASILQQET
jgi:hypothetical protein